MAMALKQALSVTDAAAERIQALLAERGKPSVGVRVGVRSRGCSGLSYTLEYADEKGKFDEIVEDKGVTILVDPKAVMFILGTEMDYVEEKLQSGFVFRNPNEKGRCGCGKSFHVTDVREWIPCRGRIAERGYGPAVRGRQGLCDSREAVSNRRAGRLADRSGCAGHGDRHRRRRRAGRGRGRGRRQCRRCCTDREGFESDLPIPPLNAPARGVAALFEGARLRAERAWRGR